MERARDVTGGAGPKLKGSRCEREVVEYLRGNGFPDAARAYGAGRADDHGDILGVPDFTLQVRNTNTIDLAGGMNDAARQRDRARTRFAAVIHRRRNRSIRDAYVTMTLAQFCELRRSRNDDQ